MRLHILLISLLVGVSIGFPFEEGGSQEEKQSLAIEELRQNLSTIWAEIDGLKVSLETHIKETDSQYYYDPSDHHHDDHHGHQEGEYHGDHHHDDHYHDHHHEGENHTAVDAKEGKSLESGYDHAYDHSPHDYDHHHHHHDDYDHHLQHEGSGNVHDPHSGEHHNQDHHHDDDHDDNNDHDKDDQNEKDSHSQENDNSSEENVDGKGSSVKKSSDSLRRPHNDNPQPDSQDHHHDHQHYNQRRHHQKEEFLKAHCHLLPNSEVPESTVTGHITITQNKDSTGPLFFKIYMKGFDVSPEDGLGYVHGFHIHENEILGQACSSAGPHFNPYGKEHGAPYAVTRHVGDLGNIRVDDKGRFENRVISDDVVSFSGKSSIIGRSIVVHQKADDLGLGGDEESLRTGNAGARLACCTIESINIPKPFKPSIRFNG